VERQISEAHYGPAVIQMLLSNLGIEVPQDAVAEAGKAASLIELNGMRVDQMAQTVAELAPQVQFWYKDHARLKDLTRLVNHFRYFVITPKDATFLVKLGMKRYSGFSRTAPGTEPSK